MLKLHMLRRLKDEILDLPPKINITEYVENSAVQQKLYDSIKADLKSRKGPSIISAGRLLTIWKTNTSLSSTR